MIQIRVIRPLEETAEARRLIYEVAHWVFKDPLPIEAAVIEYDRQGWMPDMEDIQKSYMENGGTFLVTLDGKRIIGTGAIRSLAPGECELKRLWLRPEYHGKKLGLRMLRRLMRIARKMGYHTMRLTTSSVHQRRAVEFYSRMGFKECAMFVAEFDPDEIAMAISL